MKKLFLLFLLLFPFAVVSQLPPQSSWFGWCSDTNTGAGFKVGGWAVPSTNDGWSSTLLHSYPVPFSSPPGFYNFQLWEPYHWVDTTPKVAVLDTNKLGVLPPDLSDTNYIKVSWFGARPGTNIVLELSFDLVTWQWTDEIADCAETGTFILANSGGKKAPFTSRFPTCYFRVSQPEPPPMSVPLVAVAAAGFLTGWHVWNTFRQ